MSYNPVSQKFLTVWRETPKVIWNAKTRKTHIRGSHGLGAAAGTNMFISDTVGFENPKFPAIAASTTSEHALVVWQDSRDSAITKADIFGSIVKVDDAVIDPSTGTVVTNTNDQGPGSLRQAMLNANATAGTDTITFNIPGPGPHSILPATELPALTDPVVIDGYSQPGSSPNSHLITEPDNAVHTIVIDGSGLTSPGDSACGFRIRGGNSTVRGLVVRSFPGAGILCETYGSNAIEGNYVGTDATGMLAHGNGIGVVIRDVPDNHIGGITPAARNVVSGNQGDAGIDIVGVGATGNRVQGNFIGLGADGNSPLGNASAGIRISGAHREHYRRPAATDEKRHLRITSEWSPPGVRDIRGAGDRHRQSDPRQLHRYECKRKRGGGE